MIAALFPILLIIIILGEIYTCHLLYRFTKKRSAVFAYLLLLITIIASLLLYFNGADKSKGQTSESMHIMALILLFLLPKILISIPLLVEDMFRFTRWTSNKFIYKKIITNSRSSLLTRIVLVAASLLTISIIYGVFVGKYNFKVRQETIVFKDLPSSFDGLKVLQISDLHVGSWDNKAAIEEGIKMINSQEYDVLLFTGDFVNTLATEADPWIETLQKIKTPKDGKFAVLGNHDYGEYVKWDTETDKEQNFTAIKK